MFRLLTCRLCLQRVQQNSLRPFGTGFVHLLPQRAKGGNSPNSQKTTKKRSKTKITGSLPEYKLPEDASKLREKYGDFDPDWIQELLHFDAQKTKERNFQWNLLDKTQKNRWNRWKREMKSLVKHMALGSQKPEGPDWYLNRLAIKEVVDNWDSFGHSERDQMWPRLMLSALWECPEKALDILETTTREFKVPGYALGDVINYLARWQKQLRGQHHDDHPNRLCNVAIAAFDKTSDGNIRLRQHAIFNIIQHLEPERVAALYHVLVENGNILGKYTKLSMASFLADDPSHKPLALQLAMDSIQDSGGDLDKAAWQSLCTSILSVKPQNANRNSNFSAADAFSLLLEKGFTPNMVTYTALIQSLCVAGQHDTAWRIYDIIKEHNIEPDAKLLSVMLSLSRSALSDSSVREITESAVRRNAIDVVFLNGLLSSLLHFTEAEALEKKRSGQEVNSLPIFGSMLVYYSRVFKLGPLQALVPMDLKRYIENQRPCMPDSWQMAARLFPVLDLATASFAEKMDPTGATLGIMFSAYVKTLSQPVRLISLYAYLRQLIINRNPIAIQHVREKGSFMYDIILKALLEHRGMQRPALDIFGDMLKDATKWPVDPETARKVYALRGRVRQAREKALMRARKAARKGSTIEEATDQETAKQEKASPPKTVEQIIDEYDNKIPERMHPPPSIYTWNILLAGLLFQREKESAKRIQQMMSSHGIEANEVTWNTLVSGYAGLQDVNKTVMALQGLENGGYNVDPNTLRGFARLINKEKALVRMEKMININKKKKAVASLPGRTSHDDLDEDAAKREDNGVGRMPIVETDLLKAV